MDLNSNNNNDNSTSSNENKLSQFDPNFVLLQLQTPLFMPFGLSTPKCKCVSRSCLVCSRSYVCSSLKKVLKTIDGFDRALAVLDRTFGVETHKIGVLYVTNGQKTQQEILGNKFASPRYFKVSLGQTFF